MKIVQSAYNDAIQTALPAVKKIRLNACLVMLEAYCQIPSVLRTCLVILPSNVLHVEMDTPCNTDNVCSANILMLTVKDAHPTMLKRALSVNMGTT